MGRDIGTQIRLAISARQAIRLPNVTIDVSADTQAREAIKAFSNCATIPQIDIDGGVVVGAEIVREMYAAGEMDEPCSATRADCPRS